MDWLACIINLLGVILLTSKRRRVWLLNAFGFSFWICIGYQNQMYGLMTMNAAFLLFHIAYFSCNVGNTKDQIHL
jgi:hypothetical protein